MDCGYGVDFLSILKYFQFPLVLLILSEKKMENSSSFLLQTSQLVEDAAIGGEDLGIDSWIGQTLLSVTKGSPPLCSELYCSGAKPRRWAPLMVIRFGVIPRL